MAVPEDAKPEDRLSKAELAALKVARDRRDPALAPSLSARLYALFLRGTACSDISRLNPGISLGQVCRDRVDDGWDRRRDDYRRELLDAAAARVLQVELEAAEFLGNELAAAHKLHGDRAKRYLQTGDEKELGTFAIATSRDYRETLSVLRELVSRGDDSTPEVGEPAAAAPLALASGAVPAVDAVREAALAARARG